MKQCMCCRKQMNGFDNVFHLNQLNDSEQIKCYRCSTKVPERRALYIYEKRLYTAELCKKATPFIILLWLVGVLPIVFSALAIINDFKNELFNILDSIFSIFSMGSTILYVCTLVFNFKIVSSLDFKNPQKAGYYTENYIELESMGNGKYRATEKEETHSYDTDIYGGFGILIKIFLFCFANIWVPFYSGWVKRNAERKCKEVCSTVVFDSYKKARESIDDKTFLRDPKIQ